MFDAQSQLLVSNQRYSQMYGLSSTIVKPGCSLRDLLQHRKDTGTFAGDIARYCDRLEATLADGSAFTTVTALSDGRIIQVVNQATPGGGWVATHEDITEREHQS